jgi:hypothetical protein
LSQPKHVQTLVDKFSTVADLVTEKTLHVEAGTKLCKTGVAGLPESPLLDVSVYKYRELIGGLSYISCSTRPDISFIVNQLARYSNEPRQIHWNLAIDVLRYLKHTQNWGICLGQGSVFGDIVVNCTPDAEQLPVTRNVRPLNQNLMLLHTQMQTMEQVLMTRNPSLVSFCMCLVDQCPGPPRFSL